jgi:hypothetical protein
MGEIFEVRFEIHRKSGLKRKNFVHPTGPKMADFGILRPLGLSGVLVNEADIPIRGEDFRKKSLKDLPSNKAI